MFKDNYIDSVTHSARSGNEKWIVGLGYEQLPIENLNVVWSESDIEHFGKYCTYGFLIKQSF